jgi:predicted ATPase
LIVIFEDLHWIDSETQALLNLIADGIATARLLLLVNYRPEYRHQWGGKTYYTQLRLDPFGRENAEEMLDALLSIPDTRSSPVGQAFQPVRGGGGANAAAPADLAALKRLINERTEGNPFFMEEMVQALFEQGVLVRDSPHPGPLPAGRETREGSNK